MMRFGGDGSWEDWCRSGYDDDEQQPISHCARCGCSIYEEIDECEDDAGNVICKSCYYQMEEENEE